MTISVCMIVKNEEDILARCLDCVQKFADEIIIVDTGSTDNTKSVAQKYTNKVFDFVWVDDFSKARNYAFSLASCDYQMWLDADDIISPKNISKILNLKKEFDNTTDVFMCKYALLSQDNHETSFSYYRERILKTKSKFVWQGFVHEAIYPKGKIEYTDIEITHKRKQNHNPKRNIKIYQKHKKNNEKFDARAQYYFAKEFFYLGYYSSCIFNLKKYLKLPNKFLPNVIDANLHLAKCYSLKKNYKKAVEIAFKTITTFAPDCEIICCLADNLVYLEKYETAIYFYESSLLLKPDSKQCGFVNSYYFYLHQYLQLTYLYFKLGNKELAKKYHLMAKKNYPNNDIVKYNDKFFNVDFF